MSETLETLPLETFAGLPSVISSPVSVSGVTLCDLPVGPTTGLYGLAPVPANLSARQAQAQGLLMSGTSGPPGTTSSASAALQSSLGSRLQARMPYDGLTLFKLTWKERVTPSGRLICALRASVRRTSDSDCSSWPTPRSVETGRTTGNPDRAMTHRSRLEDAIFLASWPTPAKQNGTGGARRGLDPRGWNTLQTAAALASWGTPAARDWKDGACNLERVPVNGLLGRQCRLADSGQTQTGSPAETKSIGQLNPALSRWLMGLPPAWDDCAVTGTPSSPH
jgi:hypothetical protein